MYAKRLTRARALGAFLRVGGAPGSGIAAAGAAEGGGGADAMDVDGGAAAAAAARRGSRGKAAAGPRYAVYWAPARECEATQRLRERQAKELEQWEVGVWDCLHTEAWGYRAVQQRPACGYVSACNATRVVRPYHTARHRLSTCAFPTVGWLSRGRATAGSRTATWRDCPWLRVRARLPFCASRGCEGPCVCATSSSCAATACLCCKENKRVAVLRLLLLQQTVLAELEHEKEALRQRSEARRAAMTERRAVAAAARGATGGGRAGGARGQAEADAEAEAEAAEDREALEGEEGCGCAGLPLLLDEELRGTTGRTH